MLFETKSGIILPILRLISPAYGWEIFDAAMRTKHMTETQDLKICGILQKEEIG